ncbi:hypothetical protein [uncultured Marinobacter sp.]|uniref:hypothetical protein n=1 Tax=uncultured Marinobacter sp. TaxID=187379 RepID=UPI0030DA0046|tara:strand:+ start:712 stop:1080 length:369 start_codon:yes stop_codon:yes gene_type:complete
MISKYILGGAGIIVATMAIAIWFLIQERDAMNERVGELTQANSQLEQSLTEQANENAELSIEIQRRDKAVLAAKRARERAESEARAIRQERDEALQDDPWNHGAVPAAVVNSLQAGARQDED